MKGSERRVKGILEGNTPLRYRCVVEFDPPRRGEKKDPETGSNEIHRVEFFTDDAHVFYWLVNKVSRQQHQNTEDGVVDGDIGRMEAVILEDGAEAIWRDRNLREES